MNQCRDNLVFVVKRVHIISAAIYADRNPAAREHLYNCLPQTVKIVLDQTLYILVSPCLRPVLSELPALHRPHHGQWIVHFLTAQIIPVIPTLHLVRRHTISFTELLHLLLDKSDVAAQISRIDHGILVKIVHRGLPLRANHRKDSCQIRQTDVILRLGILEHHAQKFYIIQTFPAVLGKLPNRIIPLVKNNHKFAARRSMNDRQRRGDSHFIVDQIWIFHFELFQNILANIMIRIYFLARCFHKLRLNIHKNCIIPIEIFQKSLVLLAFERFKQISRIRAPAEIRHEHMCRDRLSKAAWTAAAKKFLVVILFQQSVDHSRLVHKVFRFCKFRILLIVPV